MLALLCTDSLCRMLTELLHLLQPLKLTSNNPVLRHDCQLCVLPSICSCCPTALAPYCYSWFSPTHP